MNSSLEINRSNHPIDVLIRNHIPKFHGLEQVGFTNGIVVTEDFLVLDDITEGTFFFLNDLFLFLAIDTAFHRYMMAKGTVLKFGTIVGS